jgi:energy-converting hydrogenase Eha subunit E
MEIRCPSCHGDNITSTVGGFSIVGMFLGAAFGLVVSPFIVVKALNLEVPVIAVPFISLLSAILLGMLGAMLGQGYVRNGCRLCGYIWSPRLSRSERKLMEQKNIAP